MKRQDVIKNIWLPILVGCFLFSFDLKYDLIGMTFIILIFQNVFGLAFASLRKVNLLSVYFTFTLVFFSILPWLHYSGGHAIWRSNLIIEPTYLIVNAIIMMAGVCIFFVYVLAIKNRHYPKVLAEIKNKNASIFLLLLMSLLSFILLFYLNNFSFIQLLFRGLVEDQRVVAIESSSLALLTGMIARLTPVFCFFYAVTQINGKVITKCFLFILMLVSVFPTGIARYMAAFTYIPLLLIFVPPMRSATIFAAVLILSLIYIFPFLEQFRYFSGFTTLRFLPSIDFFYAAHFDAYENFASAVESDYITYGYQLMGSILFFIPRVFWPDKPVGSGYEMAENLGYSFNNISMPFLGEGYVNFGIAGVLIFATLLGYLMAKMDLEFAAGKVVNDKKNYLMAIYYFMIGALFFLLRGDLLSSFAFITAGLVVALIVGSVMKLINAKSIRL